MADGGVMGPDGGVLVIVLSSIESQQQRPITITMHWYRGIRTWDWGGDCGWVGCGLNEAVLVAMLMVMMMVVVGGGDDGEFHG